MKEESIKKNEKGMTLIEMLVAVSVFVVVVVMSSNIFTSIISGQRRSIAQQNTQENMRYVFEILSKEIRDAQKSNTDCYSAAPLPTMRIFNTVPAKNILYLKNKNDECVAYFLVDGVLMLRRGTRLASTTPSFLDVTGLIFEVTDNKVILGAEQRVQPRVTIKMRATMRNQPRDNIILYMQTTVSSRYYE